MARIKIVEVQNLLNNTIDAKWVGIIYLIQYPYEPQLNYIAFSYMELGKEMKNIPSTTLPVVYEFTTFGTPKIKKIPAKTIKQLYLKY
jgi:hypothetical protein